jgi:mRNA interferase MazF
MTTTIFEPFDVVEVPFPFSDLPKAKKRKALVITPKEMNEKNQATTLMMITSRKNSTWHGDVQLENWDKAGLKKSCFVRFKFFTADNNLVKEKVGSLTLKDRDLVRRALNKILP